MKVVHVNTWDVFGGAATAMYRWHRALVDDGIDSSVLCCTKSSDDPTVFSDVNLISEKRASYSDSVQSAYFDSNRTSVSNTHFSHPYGKYRIREHRAIKQADVIHLHWFSQFVDLSDLVALREAGKTIVLTPHDLWAITGGCHFPAECRQFLSKCYPCPLLENDPVAFVPHCQQVKTEVLTNTLDGIICPSHWISTEIAAHPRFSRVPLSVVPYCLDEQNLFPEDKLVARKAIDIAPEKFVVLFVAHHVNELRKGFGSFLDLLQRLSSNPGFVEEHRSSLKFLIIGCSTENVSVKTDFEVEVCGFLSDRAALRRYFSAANLLLYTGNQDNLPNVILESLACGTPVVAFKAGGVPDMLEDGVNGFMAPVGDIEQLERILRKLVEDRAISGSMTTACVQSAIRKFSPKVIRPQLLQCYDTISRQRTGRSPLDVPGPKQKYSEIPSDVAQAIYELTAKRMRDLERELQEVRWHQQEKEKLIIRISEELERLSRDIQQQARTIQEQARTIQEQASIVADLQSVTGWLRRVFNRIKPRSE
jgi:glycosyltransferase involved in cell wall biosynthesis